MCVCVYLYVFIYIYMSLANHLQPSFFNMTYEYIHSNYACSELLS